MKNQKETKLKKPNIFLFMIILPLFKLTARFLFNARFRRDKRVKKLKSPFIVLGTHSSLPDVGLITVALSRRLNIVCGRDVFSWGWVKPIQNALGLLRISQFSMDLSSLRIMKKATEQGLNLLLCPEGKISIDGRNLHYLSPSLSKLLKMLGVPVVFVHSNGGHSSVPKWHKGGIRRGKVLTETKLLFTAEEVKSLPATEMQNTLIKHFTYNDHEYQRENKIRFKSKNPALGLHFILFKCPKCLKEYENESTEHQLICNSCGNTVTYTEYGEIIPDNGSLAFAGIDDWYDFQRESIKNEVTAEGFYESHPVVWEQNLGSEYTECGEGELYINHEQIGFKGIDLNGEPIEFATPLKTLHTIVQKTKEAVDLTVNGIIHRFYFREQKYSVRYTLLVEESFRKINEII